MFTIQPLLVSPWTIPPSYGLQLVELEEPFPMSCNFAHKQVLHFYDKGTFLPITNLNVNSFICVI